MPGCGTGTVSWAVEAKARAAHLLIRRLECDEDRL